MATTSPDNIWTPDSGDDYALTVDLAAMADTVQDALTDLRGEVETVSDDQAAFAGLDGDRLSLAPPQLRDGIQWTSTDTRAVWRRVSGSWVRVSPSHAVAAYGASGAHNTNPPVISIKTGLLTGTTDVTGILAHSFPEAFPTTCIGVVFMPSQSFTGDNPVMIAGSSGGVSAGGFTAFFPGQPNTTRSLPYIAFGY